MIIIVHDTVETLKEYRIIRYNVKQAMISIKIFGQTSFLNNMDY